MKEKNGYTKRILLMLIPCVLISLLDFIAWPVFLFAVIEIAIMPYAVPVLIILNIICYCTVNERRAMNNIFITELFLLVIYPLLAYALFEFEIHGMLM